MSDQQSQSVAVSRAIDAPALALFAILTDTGNHPLIDGSGMVREARPRTQLTGVGDTFLMAMHNNEMGSYEMQNHVMEFDEGARIAWEPVLAAASRPEDQGDVGAPAHHRWGFTLASQGPDRTVVTETFDCTASPEWLQRAVKGGQRWIGSMEGTLEKLDALASGRL